MKSSPDQLRAYYQSIFSSYTAEFLTYISYKLQCCDYLLFQFLNVLNPLPLPPAPPNYQTEGNIEFGTLLFLIQNPKNITGDTDYLVAVNTILLFFLEAYQWEGVQLADSLLSQDAYNSLSTGNYTYYDGSILGTNLYETYDQKWLASFLNFLITNGNYYHGATLPTPNGDNSTTITSLSDSNIIKVGLISDWGTNQQPALDVLTALSKQNPDCIVHLGDVYYSGSPTQAEDKHYINPGEEDANLIQPWSQIYEVGGKSFTLNSNHEMYTGAMGYFKDALNVSGPFSAQNGYSMFTLKIADWTILALDSAYNSALMDLYMYGQLDPSPTDSNPNPPTPQQTWINGLNLNPNKVIVLTHHNGFDSGTSPAAQPYYSAFWNAVHDGLGADPYAWYWGHVHDGIVYMNPVKIKKLDNSVLFETNTYCRCLGNGALPYGISTETISGINNVAWASNNVMPNPDGGNNLLYNGYVVLSFTVESNVVTTITESFYDISSKPLQYSASIFNG